MINDTRDSASNDLFSNDWFGRSKKLSIWDDTSSGCYNSNIAWGEAIEHVDSIDEDARFKNYYRDYTDCHQLVIITYPKKILFYNMKQRIEFKGSCSRKHQRPRKLRGQRLF
ncbi:hypothetical protein LCGC14_1637010 [marine sediment metagenome]|uniref:Uncharacterized protein n=1 Tax=marine sediment metagenome TaxID=412755 RepID=A0A0F9I0U0_9ZZZZ